MDVTVKVKMKKCERCGHVWLPRKDKIRQCAKCKSAYWNVKKG